MKKKIVKQKMLHEILMVYINLTHCLNYHNFHHFIMNSQFQDEIWILEKGKTLIYT